MGTDGTIGSIVLTYVVPAYNSTAAIEGTLKELGTRLSDRRAEIVVVENGSTDGTQGLLDRIVRDWAFDQVRLRLLTSAKGLGNAYRAGIAASEGDTVVLTADDLPFGFDDLDAFDGLDRTVHRVIIGSKAHPDSVIARSPLRNLLTWGFAALRWLILGMRTRDPQGTFIVDGNWVRRVEPMLMESGFLLSTELCYLAERYGIRPLEVPVRLRESHRAHGSRIHVKDVWLMGVGLWGIRRRYGWGTTVSGELTE